MIAVDTNVLVYAARSDVPQHRKAVEVLSRLAEGDAPWALPWPCVYEFIKVITHPRIFARPTPLQDAVEMAESFLDAPAVVPLGNGPGHRGHFRVMVLGAAAAAGRAHDAHIAALALEHGVTEILTADRDFSRFPHVRVRNPFA